MTAKGLADSERLVTSCIRAIGAANPALNAFSHVRDAAALLDHARRANVRRREGTTLGPLDGVPIAVKDNICTKTQPTGCASSFLKGCPSPFNATCVEQLEAAGCIVVGKTNMDEFGMGSYGIHSVYGPVRNPLSLDRVAGGSSSGSAAAVASGIVDIALGSDTGGSVRLPASYCGVVGFKPSYGRFSRWGLVAYASSLDTVGILSHDVTLASRVFEVISRHDPKDATSVDFSQFHYEPLRERMSKRPLRIGVPREFLLPSLPPSTLNAWSRAVTRIEQRLGSAVSIVPVTLPHLPLALPAYYVLAPAEASSNLARFDGVRFGAIVDETDDANGEKESNLFSEARTRGFGKEVQRRILLGTYILSAGSYKSYYEQAQSLRRIVQQDFDAVFAARNFAHESAIPFSNTSSGVDVLLTPAALGPAPLVDSTGGDSGAVPSGGQKATEYANDVMTVPASLAGIPAIVLPCGGSENWIDAALPVGIQLMAQYGDDQLLFEVGKMLEEACK
ncbi:Glutamyl-tRNA amidotransferase subunit A, mitochondrial [Zopfochytrium polystomum]|nr:Glutamyl-tRNA amidotransferase subunit A, mitochondrial [Zopfochytrium polystomum]